MTKMVVKNLFITFVLSKLNCLVVTTTPFYLNLLPITELPNFHTLFDILKKGFFGLPCFHLSSTLPSMMLDINSLYLNG